MNNLIAVLRREWPKSTRGRWYLGIYLGDILWCLICGLLGATSSLFLWGIFDLAVVAIIVTKAETIFPNKVDERDSRFGHLADLVGWRERRPGDPNKSDN